MPKSSTYFLSSLSCDSDRAHRSMMSQIDSFAFPGMTVFAAGVISSSITWHWNLTHSAPAFFASFTMRFAFDKRRIVSSYPAVAYLDVGIFHLLNVTE